MSKSKKNIVDPVHIIKRYGADTARFFMFSDSPPERKLEWTNSGIDGSNKFLVKIWKFFHNLELKRVPFIEDYNYTLDKDKNLISNTHLYIDKVTNSLEKFQYNVAVAQIREFSNLFLSYKVKIESKETLIAFKFSLTKWVILISPMVPHLAEELWKKLGYDTLVCFQKWPIAKLKYIQNKNANIVVQVNGKKKLVLSIPKDLTENQTQDLLMKEKMLSL